MIAKLLEKKRLKQVAELLKRFQFGSWASIKKKIVILQFVALLGLQLPAARPAPLNFGGGLLGGLLGGGGGGDQAPARPKCRYVPQRVYIPTRSILTPPSPSPPHSPSPQHPRDTVYTRECQTSYRQQCDTT